MKLRSLRPVPWWLMIFSKKNKKMIIGMGMIQGRNVDDATRTGSIVLNLPIEHRNRDLACMIVYVGLEEMPTGLRNRFFSKEELENEERWKEIITVLQRSEYVGRWDSLNDLAKYMKENS